MENKNKNLVLIAAAVVMISALAFMIYRVGPSSREKSPVACTMEAKICADGSAVGRTGPNCEFAECLSFSSWELIKRAIADCEVESVGQTHSRNVTAKLKSGGELSAVEPEIDEIIDLAVAAEPKCGRIWMATE